MNVYERCDVLGEVFQANFAQMLEAVSAGLQKEGFSEATFNVAGCTWEWKGWKYRGCVEKPKGIARHLL